MILYELPDLREKEVGDIIYLFNKTTKNQDRFKMEIMYYYPNHQEGMKHIEIHLRKIIE